jgi:anthranilate/para-aminobenzoate synthase component I
MLELWPRRRRRDLSPWLIGWMDYEEAAHAAGGLPARVAASETLTSCWLLEPEAVGPAEPHRDGPPQICQPGRWSLDAGAFCDKVEEIRRRIAAGDVYQVNLCRRFSVDEAAVGVRALAAASVRGGVPDYLAVFETAEIELVCASMELLLSLRGDRLETCPIKGTRRRGCDADEDNRLGRELADDPKERSELAMVVDLERNDLGRVCEIGTVIVEDPGSVRRYASVHHLVARVVGRLRVGTPWWRLLAAMAPGGSITGCPKRAAMQVIRELEPVSRGPFTGVLGVVAGDGDLELTLPIRTAWRSGSALHLGAGCGIVWDSDPVSEEAESRLKVARWLELLKGAS